MTTIRKAVYKFCMLSWVGQIETVKQLGLNINEFNTLHGSKMFDKLFKRMKKQKLIDKFKTIMLNEEKSIVDKKDNISEQLRKGFEKETGIKLLNVLHDSDMDKYDEYLEQIPRKMLDVINRLYDEIPKTEFNQKGFPVSHMQCKENATKKDLLKELKAEIERVIRGEV